MDKLHMKLSKKRINCREVPVVYGIFPTLKELSNLQPGAVI